MTGSAAWQPVAGFLHDEPPLGQLLREAALGDAAAGEDEQVAGEHGLELRREEVAEPHAVRSRSRQLQMVLDPDARAVEPLRIEVALVLVERVAEGSRADGQRHVRARRREELGRREAGGVAAPVRHDDPSGCRDRPREHVPRLHHLDSVQRDLRHVRASAGGDHHEVRSERGDGVRIGLDP